MACARGGQVRYADERLGRRRVEAPQAADGYGGQARRHRGEVNWVVVGEGCWSCGGGRCDIMTSAVVGSWVFFGG